MEELGLGVIYGWEQKEECSVHQLGIACKNFKHVNTEMCIYIILTSKEIFPALAELSVGVNYLSVMVFSASGITHMKEVCLCGTVTVNKVRKQRSCPWLLMAE